MYIIGYLDDEEREYENYKIDFAYHDIELVNLKEIYDKSQLRDKILQEKFDAIIIDYDLSKFSNAHMTDGNELVRYLNAEIPDFPSIILTSYPDDSKNQNTVVNELIIDRDVLTKDVDSDQYKAVIDLIVNSIKVFYKRMQINIIEYRQLVEKKKTNLILQPNDERRMLTLYQILFSYEQVDELNPELLTSSLENKLDTILNTMNKLLKD